MKSESVGPNWVPYVKRNFVFYDHCCDRCSHATWIRSAGDPLQYAGEGHGAWYRMSCKSPGPDGMNDSGLQTTPDFNGRPEEYSWADVIEHGYDLEHQAAEAKRWIGRINAQFKTEYTLEDFS
jgi:hypothetical protein